MSILYADSRGDNHKSELFFGIVAPVGAPTSFLQTTLDAGLKSRGYSVTQIRVSDELKRLKMDAKNVPNDADEYTRITLLQDRGNELRRSAGSSEALALVAAARINEMRPREDPKVLTAHAFIIRQLKHPDEVIALRHIYGQAFLLIGLYSPAETRENWLQIDKGMSADQAKDVIRRDEGEDAEWGQQLRNTFHMADVFIDARDVKETGQADHVRVQVNRFLSLLFGSENISPDLHEYGMYLAQAAALRSADLSRQVGAAILAPRGEVLGVGANDVPRFGGGQYWPGSGDQRDHVRGFDSNTEMRNRILEELCSVLDPDWLGLCSEERAARLQDFNNRLYGTRVVNLTEFGRAVHAEMEAIIAVARVGHSISGATLYTTTFPCHNCAKHIVAAGLSEVVYVEPYPKSLASELHADAIAFDVLVKNKVTFKPFMGVAPRRYPQLFSSITEEGELLSKKDTHGKVRTKPLGLRLKSSPLTFIENETIAAKRFMEVWQASLFDEGDNTDGPATD